MSRFLSILLLMCCLSAMGAPLKTIPPGSKIFVSADGGFDTYLAAALQKKKVPLVVVTDKNQADYELQGLSSSQQPGLLRTILLGESGTTDNASITLVNFKTSEVVFAYTVTLNNAMRGQQTTAESCAKHLKAVVGSSH